jgi:hypothetical protein
MSGQINRGSARGEFLYNIAKNNSYHNYIEIGTWNGLGSTKCFKDGFEERDDDWTFHSFESNKNWHDIARGHYKQYDDERFQLVWGRVIDVQDIVSVDEALRVSKSRYRCHYKNWLQEDVDNYDQCENKIHLLNDTEIDVVFLDGGEFSTLAEFKVFYKRAKVIILDDIIELKTERIHEKLSSSHDWYLLYQTHEGNGFAAYEFIG